MTNLLWLTALTPIAVVIIHELAGILYLRFLRQYYVTLQAGGSPLEPDQLAGLVAAFFKRGGRRRRRGPRLGDRSGKPEQDDPRQGEA